MPTAAETDATVSAPSPASPVPVGEAESPKKKVPRWIWLALSIFLLAAAAVIFFVGIESSGDSDDYLAELNYANGGLLPMTVNMYTILLQLRQDRKKASIYSYMKQIRMEMILM